MANWKFKTFPVFNPCSNLALQIFLLCVSYHMLINNFKKQNPEFFLDPKDPGLVWWKGLQRIIDERSQKTRVFMPFWIYRMEKKISLRLVAQKLTEKKMKENKILNLRWYRSIHSQKFKNWPEPIQIAVLGLVEWSFLASGPKELNFLRLKIWFLFFS